MLPEDWTAKRLSELTSRIGDGIHSTPIYSENSDIFFVNGNNIRGGRLELFESTKKVDLLDAENHSRPIGPATLLLSINGTIGSVGLYQGESVVLGKSICYLNPTHEVNPKFLFYQLQSNHVQKHFEAELTGTTIRNLSLKTVRETLIPTPSLREQTQIVQILSTWDKSIEATEQLLESSKRRKKALMQQLLTGKKRLPGFAGTWETKSLAEVADILIGGTPSRSNPKYWDSEKKTNNRWLSIANLNSDEITDTSEYLTDEGVKNSNVKLLPAGTIVMSFKLSIGKKAILQKPCYTNEAICGFVINNKDLLVTSYLFHALETIDMTSEVDVAIKGATLNKEKLKGLLIRLPERDEQVAISQILDTASQEQKKIELVISRLNDEKAALMQQLLTGKKRVKV